MLEGNQHFRFPNPGELVLESVWQPLIELPVEGLVVPAGARRISVEVKGVFHSLARVLVPKVLDADSGFVDGVARAEEAAELVDEHRGQGQPSRRHEAGRAVGGRGLEPIERRAFEVEKHKCHLRGLVWEILPAEYDIHGALEYESIKLSWVGSVKCVGAPWLDAGLGFSGCGWCRRRRRDGKRGQMVSHGTERVRQLGLVLVVHVVFGNQRLGSRFTS